MDEIECLLYAQKIKDALQFRTPQHVLDLIQEIFQSGEMVGRLIQKEIEQTNKEIIDFIIKE